jgi:DNA topoisomerase 2-associated protein PAT1
MPVITHPQQLMELSEDQRRAYLEEDAKRAKRNHKIFLLSKGNGLMTPQDKNFITRIQLQQLVAATGNSADPSPEAALAEDFYYQVYSQIRGAPRQHPGQPLGHFAQTYLLQTGGRSGANRRNQINGDNHMQRMQQQVQRAVEAAKLKPKNKQLIIEGSLGKISFSNAKTPKPLLNIKQQQNPDSRPGTGKKGVQSPSDRKTILRNIETVYSTLMKLEDHERKMPPPPQEGNADAVEAHIEWRQQLSRLNVQLWQELKVLEPIDRNAPQLHPFIASLSFAKGKKVIPRVFRLIDQEQRVTILTMIVVHLDQLDVVRNGRIPPGESQPAAAAREEIELFTQTVLPSLLSYVSDAPLNIMAGLLALILSETNLPLVLQTKIGLGILTMLLSRAELVKSSNSANDADSAHWTDIYNRFFDFLEPHLAELFPGPVNTGDDIYIWQFLAAVGIGASPEQQQRLVIGVKERVMETVKHSRGLPAGMRESRLGNVNLFMRAIGLDVEMLG